MERVRREAGKMAINEELNSRGKYMLRKLRERLGEEAAQKMFKRQIEAGLIDKKTVYKSLQQKLADRFSEEEELGVTRGKRKSKIGV
jgi:competence protein ComGC